MPDFDDELDEFTDRAAGELPPERISRPREFLGPQRDSLTGGFQELESDDVVMRVFPLRANLNRSTAFCNRYLNMDVPAEMAHFEPAYPCVFMMVINYGRIADAASNMG